MANKESSPFTPGNPVPVDLFVGRNQEIAEIRRYIRQAVSGRLESIFLSGERGIGKSSLASFLRYLETTRENILGIHVFLGGVSTLEETVRRIFDQFLKETRNQSWFNKISDFFGRYIQEVGLFGVSVSFRPPDQDLNYLVRNFSEALKNLQEKVKEDKSGLFIVLDDINGLVESPQFADWYKSLVDHVATHYQEFPVSMVFIGLPERRDRLTNYQPSLMRIFRVVEIDKLSDNEVRSFFYDAFRKVGMEVEPEAMDIMVRYSSGLPLLMHEIGDAIFWEDEDGTIDKVDAYVGSVIAADRIGRKYLDPKVYRAIRSERYRSILRKLGGVNLTFTKREIERRLNENEKRVFHNFLRKLRDLGIIDFDVERGRGAYRFTADIYPIYIRMESERARKRRKT